MSAPTPKLSDSINRLIEKFAQIEVDEVKGHLWRIFATTSIQKDKAFAVEFLTADRTELITALARQKLWSDGVAQDAVLEFWNELQVIVAEE